MPWPPWKTSAAPAPVRRDPVKPLFDNRQAPAYSGDSVIILPAPKAPDMPDAPDANTETRAAPLPPPFAMPQPAPAPQPQTPTVSAPISGGLRMALMTIGADVTKLLVGKGAFPEEMARNIGMDPEMLYRIMTGREADVSVRVLDAMAAYLGATFTPHMVAPSAPASAAQ